MTISPPESVIPLWLDCDPGHDDAFAILIAAHHPSLNLLGITTVHGNASIENTTNNAAMILEAIGRSDIPIYPGSRKPFCRPAIHAPDIHGSSGLDGTDLLPKAIAPPITDDNPILAMRNALLAQPKGTPWIVATGTLTNVALLFGAFPEVAEHVKGVSIMGGAIGEGFTDTPVSRVPGEHSRIGNITPWAEFNFYCDPEAAQSIFSNPTLALKTTIVTLDLTHQVLATRPIQDRILYGLDDSSVQPTTLRQILHALLVYFANTYNAVFGLSTGPPLHDPLAVAVVLSNLNPGLVERGTGRILRFHDKGERFCVRVTTDGIYRGDHAAAGQLGRSHAISIEGPGIAIPRGVDVNSFWDLLLECIKRADEWNATLSTRK